MRLFRRRDNDANEPAQGPAPGASGGSTDGGDVVRAERQPTGDWMTLPPVATVSKPMPTTFRVQTLPEILTSHQDSRLSGELGHAVSADAPSGAIHGLTSSIGEGSPTAGHGDLPLREPHHAHTPEPAPAPLTVRRLADTSTAPITATAPPPVSLPEPVVSRRAADPLPLAATPSVDRPLPVARAVDAPAAAAAATSTNASGPAAPLARDEPTAAPLVGDDRVGGFEPDVDALLDPGAPSDHLASSPPPELAPPIQPRRVQRRVEPGAPAAPAIRPAAGDVSPAAPLLGDATPATTADAAPLPITPPSPSSSMAAAASASTDLPLVSPASPASTAPMVDDTSDDAGPAGVPTVSRLAESSSVPSSPASSGAPTAPLLGSAAASAADGPITTTGAAGEPSHASDDAASGPAMTLHAPAAPATPVADLAPPIQRVADTAPAPAAAPASSGEAVDDAPASAATAPADVTDVEGGGEHHADDGHDHGPAPEGASPVPSHTTPTLGAGDPLLDVQTLADSGLGTTHAAPATGAGPLPLVQTEPAGTLQAPAGRPSTDGTEASTAPVQRTLGASPSSSLSPATSALAATASSGATTPNASAPLQRTLAASPSSPSSTSSTSPIAAGAAPAAIPSAASARASASAAPSGASTPLALVRPLAGGSVPTSAGVQRSIDGGGGTVNAPSSISTLGAPTHTSAPSATAASTASGPRDATPLLRRLPSPVEHLGAVVTAESLGVQRLPDGPSSAAATVSSNSTEGASAAPAASTGGGSMPLHSPALAVPTAADVAVKAGLAERGPNGTLLYTSPPGGGATSIQRSVDGAPDVDVQRAVMAEEQQLSIAPASSSGSGGGSGDGAPAMDPAAQASALYPFIRSALEKDLRRQLEAKNRSTRFRP